MTDHEETGREEVPVVPERLLPCPVCGATMRVDSRNGITIDVCDEHGIWLDSGELDTVLMRLRGRLGRRSRKQVTSARRSGKVSGAVWGWWSLLFD